jgi:hypothetical protein
MAFHRTLFLAGLLLSFVASTPSDAERHKGSVAHRKAKVAAVVTAPAKWRPWNAEFATAGDPEERIKRKMKDPFWVSDFMPAAGQNRPITP